MARKLLISMAVAALLSACTAGPPTASAIPSSTAVEVSPSAAPMAPRTIALPHLPKQGVVVARNGGVVFVALDGRVLATLHGLELANPTEAPGPVVFRRSHAWYVLDVQASNLLRLGRAQAEGIRVLDDPAITLPTPPEMMVDGEAAGHWRFALLAPDGDRVLAQWSGECEVPVAYVSTLQAGSPVPITGPAVPRNIQESFALGWSRGDRAVVVLPLGSCANGAEVPGVYAFDAQGVATLITTVPVSGAGLARMWGSS